MVIVCKTNFTFAQIFLVLKRWRRGGGGRGARVVQLYERPPLTNVAWGPFLESPGNFSGPKSNIQIEI